jgi:hypothetical protein
MCIICIDIDRGKLDPWEASRNRTEMIDQLSEEHLKELDFKINDLLVAYLDDLTEKNKREKELNNAKV